MIRTRWARLIPAGLTVFGVAIPVATAADVISQAVRNGSSNGPSVASGTTGASSSTLNSELTIPTPSTGGTHKPKAKTQPRIQPTPKQKTSTPTETRTQTVMGSQVIEPYGAVYATITVKGQRIVNVSISAPGDEPRSAFINSQAVPLLQSETLQAQSANISVISGATLTSDAFIESLQNALTKAGL